MDVTLLFPPGTDVRSPHLAIPSLAAYLRAHGVSVGVRDLNLEGLLDLLDPERLEDAVRRCKSAAADPVVRAALDQADFVVEHVPRALADLRHPETFFDPHRHHVARQCLLAACTLISGSQDRVTYSFSNAVYTIDGIDSSRLVDLAASTADPRLNLFHDLYQDLAAELDVTRPDIVGISILNGQQILPGLMLARLLKSHGHVVVIGGTVYAKFVPELMRRPEFLDLFCTGIAPYEGEATLVALAHELATGGDLAAVPNLLSLDRHGTVILGPTHIQDVGELPTPDFSDLPLDQYLTPSPVLPIMLGKGCYFNRCKFCDIPFINSVADTPYRHRPAHRVAADIAILQARHGARCFEFTDETLSPRSLLGLGDALAELDVRARFVGYARFERGFTPEACARLHEMGVRKLFFGLESGNQATLDHMRKGIRVDTARRVLHDCVQAGIGCHVFSIIGFPEESETSARDTLRFLLDEAPSLRDPRNSFDIHAFGLDQRTDYGDNPARYGIVVDHAELARRDFPISITNWRNTRGLSQDDVARLLAEFSATLREEFRGCRRYPDALWPGFEEYAVLYADHYERRPFPYQLTLPPCGDEIRFRLVWNADVRISGDDPCTVSTLSGSTTVGAIALLVLASPRETMTADELLAELAGWFDTDPGQRGALLAELRATIDRLLAIRALGMAPDMATIALR